MNEFTSEVTGPDRERVAIALGTLAAVTDDHDRDLEQLRAEIARASQTDADTTELEALVQRLERHLDDDDDHQEAGIVERLEDAVKQYEVEHPELTSIFARIVDTLSAAGL